MKDILSYRLGITKWTWAFFCPCPFRYVDSSIYIFSGAETPINRKAFCKVT